jgi:hypothetical protein
MPQRTITDHIVDGDSANHQVTIKVLDEPGAGGANHKYEVSWPGGITLDENGKNQIGVVSKLIEFQNGPIKEFGVNGVTQEVLAAIIIDRLRSFQAGPFACDANEQAMSHFQIGLHLLQTRTRERIARGVEGTTQK